MASPDPIRLALELDLHAVPITGRMEDEQGRGRDFSGWLGFARALEELGAADAPIPTHPED